MFGESRMELDPEDRRLLPPNEGDMGYYIFWTIISMASIGLLIMGGPFVIYYLLIIWFQPKLLVIAILFINIGAVSILGIFLFISYNLSRKIDINDDKVLIDATKRKISKYLQTHIGTAYSKDALLKRLVQKAQHPYFKTYLKNYGEKVLQKLVYEGKILTAQKDGKTHYFISQIKN